MGRVGWVGLQQRVHEKASNYVVQFDITTEENRRLYEYNDMSATSCQVYSNS